MAKKESAPRRLKGYYKFSKKYPSRRGTGYAIGESRKMKKREGRLKAVTAASLVVLFVLAFVAVSLCYKLAHKPLPQAKGEEEREVTIENIGEVRAIFLDNSLLGEEDGVENFLKTAKKDGFNTVMLDFKSRDGVLTYGSSLVNIPSGYTYNTLTKAVTDKIKSEGFMIMARIYCFEDSVSPQRLDAYVYEDAEKTKIWFDGIAAEDGGVWLDPLNEKAQNYICSVIKEAISLGADCVYLESSKFPVAGVTVPVFTEDDTALNRNQVLLQFLEKAASAAGQHPLIVGVDYDGAVGGNEEKWGGTLFDTAASVCSPLIEKPENGDYVKLIEDRCALLNDSVKNNFSTLRIIPTVENQPDDSEFYEKMAKSKAGSYIIIS